MLRLGSLDNIPRITYTFRASKTASVAPPVSLTNPVESRRRQRYLRAEQALVSSLKQCGPEPTVQELQIRALEQVTGILSAHAREARDRSAKLRELLGSKDLDPQTYLAMQKERWMEEKRQIVVDSEIKAMQDHLVSINRFGRCSIARGDRGESASKLVDNEARKRANLAKFFERSSTRTPISSMSRHSVSHNQRTPRRVTMTDAPPLRLRTSIASTFTPYNVGHLRSISLDAEPSNKVSTSSLTFRSSLNKPFGSTPLEVVAEVTSNSNTSVLPRSSIDMGVPMLSESMSESAISTRSPTPPPPSNSIVPSPGDGVAMIYTPVKLRSKADILAGMDDVQLQLPSYALELIEDLDNLTFRQPLPFRTVAPSVEAGSSLLATPTRRKATASILVQESLEPNTSSRRRTIISLGSLSRLRKSRPSTPESPAKPCHSQNNRPLSNLFSITESSSSSAVPNRPGRNSMLSLPFPRRRNDNLNHPSPSNTLTSSSETHHSSKLTRPFHLFGRRWNLGPDY